MAEEVAPAPESSFPDADTFGRLVAPRAATQRAVKQLHEALLLCDPGAELEERVHAIEKLFAFLRSKRKAPAVDGAFDKETNELQRLRLLIRALESVPAARQRLSLLVRSVLDESVEGGLFGRLGLPTDRGFLAENADRVSRRFLPEPRNPRDLLALAARLVPRSADVRTLALTPPELINQLIELLRLPDDAESPLTPLLLHVMDALALLPMRVAAVGLSDVLRARSPKVRPEESPFFKLPRAVDGLLASARARRAGLLASEALAGGLEENLTRCRALITDCRAVSAIVVENLEKYGVSVNVVYRLELIQRNLDRLSSLLDQLEPAPELERARRVRALFVELASVRLQDGKLRGIARDNLHLLARKIIERAGHTGEHYITATRSDYWKMLLSAGGGGALTAGTTALKYIIGWAHFAPFVEGALAGANYAGSFVLMQLLGFTLATKQPSMTAAALAGTLRETASHPDLTALVSMIARIVRSQLAAAIGNVGLVIPAALLFDRVWRSRTGAPFLDRDTANYVLHSLHPTQSGTVFYAALTGVLLWISSIVAGSVENWAVYRRLPQAIIDHRLGRFVGRRPLAAFSRFFTRNIAGFGGNTALGLLLGMTPVMGKFFGLPLDVRHVTLSTGALTLSACALMNEEGFSASALLPAIAGIAVIGALNFGVSFILALAVALRAREVDRSDRLRLLSAVVATFLRSPAQFVFPPATSAGARVHGPVSVAPPPPAAPPPPP